MRKLLLLLFVLLIPLTFAAEFNATWYVEYNSSFVSNSVLNTTVFVGDRILFGAYNETGNLSAGTLCNVSYSGQNYSMSHTFYYNGSSTPNAFNYTTNFSSPQTVNFEIGCVGLGNISGTLYVYNRYNATLSSVKLPMVSLNTSYTGAGYEYNYTHDIVNVTGCNLTFEGVASSSPTVYSYSQSGLHEVNVTCAYPISGNKVVNLSLNVSAYEPKLSLASSNPFSSLSSTTNFKLGNFDFDGDLVDDIIILGSSGLRIYNGSNLYGSPYLNALFNSNFEFFITDMDSDGDGDVLIGNTTNVYLLKYTSDFSFTSQSIYNGTGISSFGAFEINNDFYKDLIVGRSVGLTFNLTLFENSAGVFSAVNSLQTSSFRCDKLLVVDVDKDFIQDILCVDVTNSPYAVRVLRRAAFTSYFSFGDFESASLGYAPLSFSTVDIIPGGNYELVIERASPFRYVFYTLAVSPFALSQVFNTSTYLDYYSGSNYYVDVLSEEKGQFFSTYSSDGATYFSRIYFDSFNHSLNFKDVSFDPAIFYSANTITTDPDGDKDPDVYYAVSSDASTFYVRAYNNSINLYRDSDSSYSAIIAPSSTSQNVIFNVSYQSSWQPNNYFLRVRFPEYTFRNDFYDSRQNLKYYMINASNNYTFGVPNTEPYDVEFALNKYSMILTNLSNYSQSGASCACLTTDAFCAIFTSCSGASVTNKEFTSLDTVIFPENGTANQNWQNITLNGTLSLKAATATISNSLLRNGIVNITAQEISGKILFFNTNLTSETVYLANSIAQFTGGTFTGTTFILDNSTLIVNKTVATGNASDSIIRVYNGSATFVLDALSSVYGYNCTSLAFVDDSSSAINLSGNYSGYNVTEFLSKSSISECFATKVNETAYDYAFNFTADYQYFEPQRNFTEFNASHTLIFNRTHMPIWDYATNYSAQTDFRNYSLLQNISNLTNFTLSLDSSGRLFAATFPGPVNLSDKDLRGVLSVTNSSLFVHPAIITALFSANATLDLPERFVVVPENKSNVTYANGELLGNFSESGIYEFLRNLSFSVSIPTPILSGREFNVSYHYADYFNRTVNSSACNFSINSVDYAFTNITLATGTNYLFNVTCLDSRIELATSLQYVNVTPSILFGWQGRKKYEPFSLNFTANGLSGSSCGDCNVTLNTAEYFGMTSVGSACVRNVSIPALTSNVSVVCPGISPHLENITLQDGKGLWDSPSSIAGFTANLNIFPFTSSTGFFVSSHPVNGSYYLFNGTDLKSEPFSTIGANQVSGMRYVGVVNSSSAITIIN